MTPEQRAQLLMDWLDIHPNDWMTGLKDYIAGEITHAERGAYRRGQEDMRKEAATYAWDNGFRRLGNDILNFVSIKDAPEE